MTVKSFFWTPLYFLFWVFFSHPDIFHDPWLAITLVACILLDIAPIVAIRRPVA